MNKRQRKKRWKLRHVKRFMRYNRFSKRAAERQAELLWKYGDHTTEYHYIDGYVGLDVQWQRF